jgi:general secretion pathway protein C
MLARLSAFVIWALIGATAVFWGLRFLVQPAPAPVHSVVNGDSLVVKGDLSRLLGAAPAVSVAAAPAAEANARFRLLGIVAPQRVRAGMLSHGVALIAVDGKPARAYTVGSRVDTDLVLQSVSLRTASIGPAQGAKTVVLEIPAFAAPATGTLPVAGLPAVSASPSPQAAPPALQGSNFPPPPVVPAAAAPPGGGAVVRDGGMVAQ